MNTIKTFVITVIISALVGSLATFGAINLLGDSKEKTNNELIKEFYAVENAAHVSPHGLRGKLDKGGTTVLLIDLLSAQEYEQEHIAGAINIPAYSDPNTPVYQEIDRIVGEFQKLPKDKEVIVYCYSIPCMTGRKIGKILVEKGIYVKHLVIGWNEWRYFWNLWNHEG